MRNFKLVILSLFIFSGITATNAQANTHILTGSTSSSFLFDKSSSWSDDYDATFSLGVGYDYALTNGFQLGGQVGVNIFSGGSVMTLAIGPGYNFNTDIANSFFVSAKVGYSRVHIDAAMTDDDTFFLLKAGKRFKILENVSYVPGLQIQKVVGDNAPDPSFTIELFNFSILF